MLGDKLYIMSWVLVFGPLILATYITNKLYLLYSWHRSSSTSMAQCKGPHRYLPYVTHRKLMSPEIEKEINLISPTTSIGPDIRFSFCII